MVGLACLGVLAVGLRADLAAEVVSAHGDTLARYRTVQGHYLFKSSKFPELNVEADCYRDVERTRMQLGRSAEGSVDILFVNGQARQLTRIAAAAGRKSEVGAHVWPASYDGLGACYPWDKLLIAFRTEGSKLVDLATIAADPSSEFRATADRRDGKPMIRTEYMYASPNGSKKRVIHWHDPARSYLAVRREIDSTPPPGRSQAVRPTVTVVDDYFVSGPDGLHLPIHSVLTASGPDGDWTQEVRLDGVKVNQPLPGGSLDLPLPAGVRVLDEVRRTQYVGGADWKPAGPETLWMPTVATTPQSETTGQFIGPSVEEPRSVTRIVLIVSTAILVVSAITLLALRAWGANTRA